MSFDELTILLATDRSAGAQLQEGPLLPAEAEPLAIEDISDALVIRENGTFLLMDKSGEVPRRNISGFGFYRGDTRHLSRYEFSFSNVAPVVLLSTAALGFAAEQVLTNATMESLDGEQLRRESIQVRRQRVLADSLAEHLSVTSFHRRPLLLEVRYSFDADFADIFEIRGATRERRGNLDPIVRGDNSISTSGRAKR